MMFWIAILTGVIFVVIGIRKKFCLMWVTFFNIMVTIYSSIMLTPTIIGLFPNIKDIGYNRAICVLGVGAIVFAILHAITNYYFIDIDKISFPEIPGKIGAGILGFISGYFMCSFVLFVICITPFPEYPFVKNVFGEKNIAPTAAKTVDKVCNFVGAISLQVDNSTNAKVIDWLASSKAPLADTNSVDNPKETSAE